MNEVYGIKDQKVLEENTGLTFVKELCITTKRVICQLKGVEKCIFRFLYAGKTSRRLYKLYEYKV